MGNHELNAICYATPDTSGPGDFLRSHRESWGLHNRQQHLAFLDEFDPGSAEHSEWIKWMLRLPLWIETNEFRVVHACWDQQAIDRLSLVLSGRRLVPAQLANACGPHTVMGADIAGLLKGPELHLPENLAFLDRSGHTRDHIRRAWWRTHARTYSESVLLPSGINPAGWDSPLPPELTTFYTDHKPTFFGHYCMIDTPPIVGQRTACLDTCAARGHRLTAYRWDGEANLTPDHLWSVLATP